MTTMGTIQIVSDISIMFLDIIHHRVHFFINRVIGASSIYWIQLSRFYLRTETESSLRNVWFFLKMDKTMDNVQKHNTCNNIPSSQTFKSYVSDSFHVA
jgi:hypothetical protein